MVRKTTTARKTTARRTTKAAAKTTAPKPVAAKAPVEDTATADIPVTETAVKAAEKTMGKRELIDRVVAASGIKKSAAKPVIVAMLKELGDGLSRGETLNLQPFGKANVKRHKHLENAEIIELRLRRSKLALKAAETSFPDPLAEAAE